MIKPKILLFVGTYLPGYKGGGPTQSTKNLVNGLKDKFDFFIFTSNHDFGEYKPFKTVQTDEWNEVNENKIFYSSEKNKKNNIKKIIKENKFDLIFLNSFFSSTTILIARILKLYKVSTPVILMPRGELSVGALSIKRSKKIFYINIYNLLKLGKNFYYLSTAEDEEKQINKLIKGEYIRLISNVPSGEKKIKCNTKKMHTLKVVFLSRITSKKNLDYAIESLQNCTMNIEFHIYGTLEDRKYWEYCKQLISKLPKNVSVNYKGELVNEKVIETLSNYDLFYLPTKSENYGHVISEALQASIPVLISNNTPWSNLKKRKIGWEFDLSDRDSFTRKLDELAALGTEEFNLIKEYIFENFDVEEKSNKILKQYSEVIEEIIGS